MKASLNYSTPGHTATPQRSSRYLVADLARPTDALSFHYSVSTSRVHPLDYRSAFYHIRSGSMYSCFSILPKSHQCHIDCNPVQPDPYLGLASRGNASKLRQAARKASWAGCLPSASLPKLGRSGYKRNLHTPQQYLQS